MCTYIIVAEALSIPFRSKAASNQSQQCCGEALDYRVPG